MIHAGTMTIVRRVAAAAAECHGITHNGVVTPNVNLTAAWVAGESIEGTAGANF